MVKHYSNEPIYPTNKKLLIMDATPEAFMKERLCCTNLSVKAFLAI